mmetsp:Transcript_27578/g.78010  ORF Transcript_27578/g.78010 Transcript_27578/m.78010 type:complete len:483 (-) Transcript_27578:161-1609(-)
MVLHFREGTHKMPSTDRNPKRCWGSGAAGLPATARDPKSGRDVLGLLCLGLLGLLGLLCLLCLPSLELDPSGAGAVEQFLLHVALHQLPGRLLARVDQLHLELGALELRDDEHVGAQLEELLRRHAQDFAEAAAPAGDPDLALDILRVPQLPHCLRDGLRLGLIRIQRFLLLRRRPGVATLPLPLDAGGGCGRWRCDGRLGALGAVEGDGEFLSLLDDGEEVGAALHEFLRGPCQLPVPLPPVGDPNPTVHVRSQLILDLPDGVAWPVAALSTSFPGDSWRHHQRGHRGALLAALLAALAHLALDVSASLRQDDRVPPLRLVDDGEEVGPALQEVLLRRGQVRVPRLPVIDVDLAVGPGHQLLPNLLDGVVRAAEHLGGPVHRFPLALPLPGLDQGPAGRLLLAEGLDHAAPGPAVRLLLQGLDHAAGGGTTAPRKRRHGGSGFALAAARAVPQQLYRELLALERQAEQVRVGKQEVFRGFG